MNIWQQGAPNVSIWLIVDEETATSSSIWASNMNTGENDYARWRLEWVDPDSNPHEADIYIPPGTTAATFPLGGVVAIDIENEDMALSSQYSTRFNFPVPGPE